MPWTSMDMDGDGRADAWRFEAPDGRVERIRYDNNGDGTPDEWVVFLPDRTVREAASHLDGRIDERHIAYRDPNGVLDHATTETLHGGVWRLDEDRRYIATTEMYAITTWTRGVATVRYETAVLY